jgi:aryl-alcohol dehydrogenase-like predicted oxidoreductase
MNPVVLGLWPIAGITSTGATRESGIATIEKAIEVGIDTFDTAYSYGYDGESDRMLGEVLLRSENQSGRWTIIGKVGQRWTPDHRRIVDASPGQLTSDAEESLKRIGIDHFDLLMLHAVDPNVDIEVSAEAIDALRQRGLTKRVGVCNVTADQLSRFAKVCDCSALQCQLNLLQQDSLDPLISTAGRFNAETHVYWTLMKGLLAGKISRDHQFDEGDSRPSYEVFQGKARERAHDIVDRLQTLADRYQTTVAKISIGWTLSQPGVIKALVGAKRPEQIIETASARSLDSELLADVDRLVIESQYF